MAEVFAAKLYGADGFEKDLVIKQILPQHAQDPEFVQSFIAEAKIAVGLHHANIVSVYELGRTDGVYYIAMEFMDGIDLFALIETAKKHRRNLGVGLVLLIAEEIAKGLEYAHRKLGPDGAPLQLVHRDLNPRNVLLSKEGEVKILDFGIAKVGESMAQMPKTEQGMVKGTRGYMSPEQSQGLPIDARTDIYQTGLLLYELLTQDALFWRPDDNETRALMQAHEIVPPSEHPGCKNKRIPPELDQIVLQALERSLPHRTSSAQDLVTQLARLRFMQFPDVDHRALAELVTELSHLAESDQNSSLDELPSTSELRGAFAGAFTDALQDQTPETAPTPPTPRRIETFAARSPSGIHAGPMTPVLTPELPVEPAVPTTVPARPMSDPFGKETPEPQDPAPDKTPALPRAVPSDAPSSGQSTRTERTPWIAIAAIGLFALGLGLLWSRSEPKELPPPKIAKSPPSPRVDPAGPPQKEPPRPLIKVQEPPPSPPPKAPPSSPRPQTKRQPPKPVLPSTALATVDFGTKSCSSRVTVDGVVVTRTTPSFGHKLSAGMHRVILEGTSCPPIERPGSLRRTLPSVSARVRIEAGASLKIIADFERNRVLVRQ